LFRTERESSDSALLRSSGGGSDFRSSLRRFRSSSFNKDEKGGKNEKEQENSRSSNFSNMLLGRTKSNEDGPQG